MRAVNLLPPDYAGAHKSGQKLPGPLSDPRRTVPVVAAVLLILGVIAGYVSASSTVNDRQETLAELQAELAARPKPEPVPAGPSDASVRLAAMSAASGARVAWEEVLQQFALVLPADVSVVSLSAAGAGADPATAVGSGFTITGYTVSQPSVARLMRQLDEAPTLANVQLQTTSRGTQNERPVIDFTVLAQVVPEGGSS